MLIFVCPYCDEPLRIPENYLGLRGKCKKCGGRVALIGDASIETPQRASRVEEEEAPEPQEPLPATDRQLDYLRVLGANESRIRNLTREEAVVLIDQLKSERRDNEPPTEEQLDYLRRLGMTSKEIVKVQSKSEASYLIDSLQPPPTDNQIQYLRRLGARAERVSTLKTKSEAAALIEEMLSKGHAG